MWRITAPPELWPLRLRSRRVFGERVSRVTGITSTVLPAHVSNECFGILCLGLKGGNERIFRVHDDVVAFFLQL